MTMRILAWDAPNMDMTLSNLLEGKPSSAQRPDLAVLIGWLRGRCVDDEEAEAAVFVNVPPHLVPRITTWVHWLRQTGFHVFAKPKVEDSDVDSDIVEYLKSRPPSDLAEVVIGSHDARAFLDVARTLSDAAVPVTVVGFAELAGGLATAENLAFVDLADIDGLFSELPPRTSLMNLPPSGRWFGPIGTTVAS